VKVSAIASASAALIALAGIARGQTVEFRIVERNAANQGIINAAPPAMGTPLDSVNTRGNYAVQARVNPGTNGVALGSYSFDIVIPGEPDANGTLVRLRITVFGYYYTGPAVADSRTGSSGYMGGTPGQYSYLEGCCGFTGSINTSFGTFTNNPAQQEIGLVLGSATDGALLNTPGIDPDGWNSPATWSGYGLGGAPNNGATASLDPTIGATYFAEGQFIDVYRFRYTVSNLVSRTFTITLANVGAQVFNQFVYNNGAWGPQTVTVDPASVTITGLQVPVSPDPGTCCAGDGGCQFVFPADCSAGSTWTRGVTCMPNTCPLPGVCCGSSGVCTFTLLASCAGSWQAVGACDPNPCPQPGSCCTAAGVCTTALQSACQLDSTWREGAVCNPNPCPQPGTCCETSGVCEFVLQSACASAWGQGAACNPNPCPQPGRCCVETGSCSLTLQATCTGASVWSAAQTCDPNPCPQPGACCTGSHCVVGFATACTGQYHGDNSVCGTPGNPTTCCVANFDGINGVAVQDIFAYLSAWFAGDPRADVNGTPGLSVYDIFAFLQIWFTGCS
jgi:hypothetical protein